MNEAKLKKVTVQIPHAVADDLKRSAQEHFRSFNGELIWAIQQYLTYGKQSTNKP